MVAPTDVELLAAESLLTKAFMIEISAWLAGMAPDRERWIRLFVSSLHERLDSHEESVGGTDFAGIHEIARQRADDLGDILRNVPAPKG
jgi:hypothetical protein